MESVGQWASKLLAVKFGGLKKKICRMALALLESVSPDSSTHGVESFSKFDG